MEIGHELISMTIRSLSLIQVGQIVRHCQKDVYLLLVNRVGSLSRNSVVRLTDRIDMTVVVDWNVKPQI